MWYVIQKILLVDFIEVIVLVLIFFCLKGETLSSISIVLRETWVGLVLSPEIFYSGTLFGSDGSRRSRRNEKPLICKSKKILLSNSYIFPQSRKYDPLTMSLDFFFRHIWSTRKVTYIQSLISHIWNFWSRRKVIFILEFYWE